jgi:hypothetical protein
MRFAAKVRNAQDCCLAGRKVMLGQMMKVLPTYPPVKQESGFGSDSCSSPS